MLYTIKDYNTEENCYTWLQISKDYLAITDGNYISLSIPELTECNHIGHEYFCEKVFLIKHKIPKSYESAIFLELHPDIINENCDFRFFNNMTPKVPVIDASETLIK